MPRVWQEPGRKSTLSCVLITTTSTIIITACIITITTTVTSNKEALCLWGKLVHPKLFLALFLSTKTN